MAIERDGFTGRDTTGHEWDGIKELDTPIPKSVIWSYGLTIALALILIILYPALPYFSDFTRGILGYSSRDIVEQQVSNAAIENTQRDQILLAGEIHELESDPAIKEKFQASAAVLFHDNCAACHKMDLKGQTGFPNLVDNHWLWQADINEIEEIILYGINSGHDEERVAEMLAFGKLQMLERSEVKDVVEYVRALSGQGQDSEAADRGATIFSENCESCHGEKGVGGLEVGAPSLVDSAWIYGDSSSEIFKSVWSGRKGHMPAWEGRLSRADIRKLALYVKWQSDAGSQ